MWLPPPQGPSQKAPPAQGTSSGSARKMPWGIREMSSTNRTQCAKSSPRHPRNPLQVPVPGRCTAQRLPGSESLTSSPPNIRRGLVSPLLDKATGIAPGAWRDRPSASPREADFGPTSCDSSRPQGRWKYCNHRGYQRFKGLLILRRVAAGSWGC